MFSGFSKGAMTSQNRFWIPRIAVLLSIPFDDQFAGMDFDDLFPLEGGDRFVEAALWNAPFDTECFGTNTDGTIAVGVFVADCQVDKRCIVDESGFAEGNEFHFLQGVKVALDPGLGCPRCYRVGV